MAKTNRQADQSRSKGKTEGRRGDGAGGSYHGTITFGLS